VQQGDPQSFLSSFQRARGHAGKIGTVARPQEWRALVAALVEHMITFRHSIAA
jgi:hypothetical protein